MPQFPGRPGSAPRSSGSSSMITTSVITSSPNRHRRRAVRPPDAELQDLETDYPGLRSADSPTLRVGGEPTKSSARLAHDPPMLSLANTYSDGEIRDFDRRVREILGDQKPLYVAELKFDGVAIALTYRNGALVQGATRGTAHGG